MCVCVCVCVCPLNCVLHMFSSLVFVSHSNEYKMEWVIQCRNWLLTGLVGLNSWLGAGIYVLEAIPRQAWRTTETPLQWVMKFFVTCHSFLFTVILWGNLLISFCLWWCFIFWASKFWELSVVNLLSVFRQLMWQGIHVN
jgi:hypothetical protein